MEEMFYLQVEVYFFFFNIEIKNNGEYNFNQGREYFVGLGQYTNEAGARAVAAAFPEYPCVPIKVNKNTHKVYNKIIIIIILMINRFQTIIDLKDWLVWLVLMLCVLEPVKNHNKY